MNRGGTKRWVLALAGLALLVGSGILSVVVLVVSLSALGPYIPVTALVAEAGDALQAGDEVRFHDLIVGSVVGDGQIQGDAVRLNLHVDPSQADLVPDNVTARALPASIFGAQFVDLVDPAVESSSHLVSGSTVPADRSTGSVQLQTALNQIHDLLTAVEPAKLNAALTALATALRGQGANIGVLVHNLDAYLRGLVPSTPVFQNDLSSLATVLKGLSADAPDLLQALGNAITTSQTLVADQGQLVSVLTGGASLSDDTRQLIAENGSHLITVVNDLVPVLAAIDQNPRGLSNGIVALDSWFKSWSTALGRGPWLNVAFAVPGVNATTAIEAAETHSRSAADQSFVPELNPTPYGAADCPRYPGASGPNCPGGASAQLATAPIGGNVGPVGSAGEEDAVVRLLTVSLGHIPAGGAALDDILAGPLYRGALVVAS